MPGSSPLARGLRGDLGGAGEGGGIIPARAGFTLPPKRRLARAPDHPRSRGVYGACRLPRPTAGGSSPLARGLPIYFYEVNPLCRIIPARAGFTPVGESQIAAVPDHPRSRGVYPSAPGVRPRKKGSSPLARGLRHRQQLRRQRSGIIPARAGFTPVSCPRSERSGDHPRSRGVYRSHPRRVRRLPGSSPLARGLLHRPAAHVTLIWIIPARAGFTFALLPSQFRDRIIPARAGFTLADPWNPNEPVLYQTPVAFTADLGSAPPSCGSAAVVLRWTTTPSGA